MVSYFNELIISESQSVFNYYRMSFPKKAVAVCDSYSDSNCLSVPIRKPKTPTIQA